MPRWSAALHAKLQHQEHGGGLQAVSAQLSANALQLCFTPHALKTWLALRANTAHYLQHKKYRCRRPQVCLCPRLWLDQPKQRRVLDL